MGSTALFLLPIWTAPQQWPGSSAAFIGPEDSARLGLLSKNVKKQD
jgi:hypothetical protein